MFERLAIKQLNVDVTRRRRRLTDRRMNFGLIVFDETVIPSNTI